MQTLSNKNRPNIYISEILHEADLVATVKTADLYNNILKESRFGNIQQPYFFIRSIIDETFLLERCKILMDDYPFVGVLKDGGIVFVKNIYSIGKSIEELYFGS